MKHTQTDWLKTLLIRLAFAGLLAGLWLQFGGRAGLAQTVWFAGVALVLVMLVTDGLGHEGIRAGPASDEKGLPVLTAHRNGPDKMVGDGVNDAPVLAAAAFGYLPPMQRALLQQAIAVTVNVLQALRISPGGLAASQTRIYGVLT